jgi:two-component system NtrC family sensor kinase
MMKVGTRLTLVLLLALTPVLIGRTYWTIFRSSTIYINDLKREIRATSRSLVPEMENDILQGEWDEIDDVLHQVSEEGTVVALLHPDRTLWRVSKNGDERLVREILGTWHSRGDDEFEEWVNKADWFCQVTPLADKSGKNLGYLMVVQDWTDFREDLDERVEASAFASLAVLGVIIIAIPLLVRRYVSKPLAELSRKVTRFSDDELRDRYSGTDEVSLLTEEFRRLGDQLNIARSDLLAKHRRELELERSLQHAERLITVGTLASGLAHEIGTPMGVIRGRAEQLLRGEPVSEKTRKGLEIIVSQIDRVSRIVRMLLDYGRSRESHRAVCDVRQIISHATSLMETEAARRQVLVMAELGSSPLLAECDAGQLQQVFVNLEMNALDAMTMQNGGTLNIRGESGGAGDGGIVKVTFEDTGPGVSPQDATRVFDPFFTTKDPGYGTGMGLAVSQSIIRDHGGEISFESGPKGSRFFVTIPSAPARGPNLSTAAPGKESPP